MRPLLRPRKHVHLASTGYFTKGGNEMAEQDKVYVCDLCGQEVKVTKSGVGTLVCCDVPMHVK